MERELTKALRHLQLGPAELSVVFVGSRRMKILNSRYRGLCKDTDVLSFPLLGEDVPQGPAVLGDIVISVPKALRQAKEFNVPFYEELRRLLVHGLLHLLGYDHETTAYQKRKMQQKERWLLDALAKVA